MKTENCIMCWIKVLRSVLVEIKTKCTPHSPGMIEVACMPKVGYHYAVAIILCISLLHYTSVVV